MGDSALSGDLRWAGTYGVNIDFVARSHCSVEFISIEAMQVSHHQCSRNAEEDKESIDHNCMAVQAAAK
jgi:hypothetical protein